MALKLTLTALASLLALVAVDGRAPRTAAFSSVARAPLRRSAAPLTQRAPAAARAGSRAAPLQMVFDELDDEGIRKFKWNRNVGRSPFGFANNAEVWNGRVAMMGFVFVTLQELITGKGVVTQFDNASGFGLIVPVFCCALGAGGIAWLMFMILTNQEDDTFNEDLIMAKINAEVTALRKETGTYDEWMAVEAAEKAAEAAAAQE